MTYHKFAEMFAVLWSRYYINSTFIEVTKVSFEMHRPRGRKFRAMPSVSDR